MQLKLHDVNQFCVVSTAVSSFVFYLLRLCFGKLTFLIQITSSLTRLCPLTIMINCKVGVFDFFSSFDVVDLFPTFGNDEVLRFAAYFPEYLFLFLQPFKNNRIRDNNFVELLILHLSV